MSIPIKLALCAASFVMLTAGGCDEPDERSSATDGPEARATPPAGASPCPHVTARPTYLPWLDEGEEVPEPRLAAEGRTSYIAWTAGDGGPSDPSLVFRRDSEPRGGRGEPVSVKLEGATGYYYAAPGSSAGVLWKTGSGPCKLITLALSLPGAGRAEVRDEMLRIVESLET